MAHFRLSRRPNTGLQGFTLIETLVYIALLVFLMGSAVFAVYNLISGAQHLGNNAAIQEEGNFVLRKIDWALVSATSFNTSVANQLTVTKLDGGTTRSIVFTLNGTEVDMSENWGTAVPITTSNVQVNSLTFTSPPEPGAPTSGVRADLTVNGALFSTTRYLRN